MLRAKNRKVVVAAATTISELPVDIITDILVKLSDIKSILTCKRVCKTWRDLILQPSFTESQLSRGSLPLSLIFHRPSSGSLDPSSFGILELDDPICLSRHNATMKFRYENLIPREGYSVRVIGACNGLVCLFFDSNIMVRNPILQGRQHFVLPKLETSTRKDSTVGMGFGYSSLSDKYKVLRCARTSFGSSGIGFEICTLGSDDKWRSIRGHKGQLCLPTYSYVENFVFVKGALHWVYLDTDLKLCCFDLEKEEFKNFPLPSQIKQGSLKLEVDNCFSLTEWCSPNRINVWLTNDYQQIESWTLKWTIEVRYPWMHFTIQPIKIWKDGTVLMIARDKTLRSYNPQTGKLQKVECNDVEFYFAEMAYTPSFVCPPWML